MNKRRLTTGEYVRGTLAGDRLVLAKAITLVESAKVEDQKQAEQVLNNILPHTGNSTRIGITGVPGVGKSTFIEAFGKFLTSQNIKVAILTVDPSSQLTKGSILGDKTRMEALSKDANAFIRPTASGSVLGGTAGRTREAMLLCEAAGFNVVLIETVGVGQSEVAVRNMVDFFLLLMLAGAGDELQGIKKGIMEMADGLVITKADGENVTKAKQAMADYSHALHLFPSKPSGWTPKVLTSSALEGSGMAETWKMIRDYMSKCTENEFLNRQRMAQNVTWFQDYFQHLLRTDYLNYPDVVEQFKSATENLSTKNGSPYEAAKELLNFYHQEIKRRL